MFISEMLENILGSNKFRIIWNFVQDAIDCILSAISSMLFKSGWYTKYLFNIKSNNFYTTLLKLARIFWKMISLHTHTIEHPEVDYFAAVRNTSHLRSIIIGIGLFHKYVINVQNFKHVWTFYPHLITFLGKIS